MTKRSKRIGWWRKGDLVKAAWGESASGPGWGNKPLWVLVWNSLDDEYRVECIQPEDQTYEMGLLYAASCLIHNQMTALVTHHLED